MTVSDSRRKKIDDVVAARQRGLAVVLEDIHDPHNAEAILRTCDAFGVQTVHFVFDKEKRYNPRRVGSASSGSANKWLDFAIHDSAAACADALHADGYTMVATMLDEKAESLFYGTFAEEKIALVFGNEHAGVSNAMRDRADRMIFVPMQGMVQSLNVSVTAAICLYEVVRQRRASGKDFLMPADEQGLLIQNFLER